MAAPATPAVSVNNVLGGTIEIAFTGIIPLDFGEFYGYTVTATPNTNWWLKYFEVWHNPTSSDPSIEIPQPEIPQFQGNQIRVSSFVAKPGIGARDSICIHVKAIFEKYGTDDILYDPNNDGKILCGKSGKILFNR